VARFLFIVARELPHVYEHLCQQFAGEANVEVIVDRRKNARPEAPAQDERRRNMGIDEELRAVGYAFVRLGD
jgi:hypothetical protein